MINNGKNIKEDLRKKEKETNKCYKNKKDKIIKTIKINNNEYTFFNEVWERGYSWGHRSVLHLNGYKLTEARSRYHNRTWESYQFQSVMMRAVEDYISGLLWKAIQDYKQENNIKRLTKSKKEIVVSKFEKENTELYKLKRSL